MRNAGKAFAAVTKGLFLPACLILVLQAAASKMLTVPERELQVPGLHQLPFEFGKWQARGEDSMEASISEYLKPDEYILRNYVDPTAGNTVNLFIAYFKTLQNAYGPHSPRVCLPGAGWMTRSSRIRTIEVPGRAEAIPVNEYLLEKSEDRILVLYWYQNNRNVWAEEFRAKLTLLPDLIRYRRSDTSLVRLVLPLRSADGGEELQHAVEYTRLLFPALAQRFRTIE